MNNENERRPAGPAVAEKARRGFASLLLGRARLLRGLDNPTAAETAAALEETRLLLTRLLPQQRHWQDVTAGKSLWMPEAPPPPQAAEALPRRAATVFSATAARAVRGWWGYTMPCRLAGRCDGRVAAPGPFAGGPAVLQLRVDGAQPGGAGNTLFFTVARGGVMQTFRARPRSVNVRSRGSSESRAVRIECEGQVVRQGLYGPKISRAGSAVLLLLPRSDGQASLRAAVRCGNEIFDTGDMEICTRSLQFSQSGSMFYSGFPDGR